MGDDENETALARDRAASTKAAFESGRYYRDDSGNMQVIPPGGVKRKVPLPPRRPTTKLGTL